jgi:ATP-dependent protease Clp ATPase subunit
MEMRKLLDEYVIGQEEILSVTVYLITTKGDAFWTAQGIHSDIDDGVVSKKIKKIF